MDETDGGLENQTYAIIGAAMEVSNLLGHGINEKPYENALVVELSLRQIPCEQQVRFDVIYKTVKVGEYVPDLIAGGRIIIDTKVIDRITNHERGQMINYLRQSAFICGWSSSCLGFRRWLVPLLRLLGCRFCRGRIGRRKQIVVP
jgi:GxxExxY protein